MRKVKNKILKLYTYKDVICLIERIKNDTYGNPRYDIIFIYQNDLYYQGLTKRDYSLEEILRITSYNVLEDIEKYIDNEAK